MEGVSIGTWVGGFGVGVGVGDGVEVKVAASIATSLVYLTCYGLITARTSCQSDGESDRNQHRYKDFNAFSKPEH